jgi:hypothetical protein
MEMIPKKSDITINTAVKFTNGEMGYCIQEGKDLRIFVANRREKDTLRYTSTNFSHVNQSRCKNLKSFGITREYDIVAIKQFPSQFLAMCACFDGITDWDWERDKEPLDMTVSELLECAEKSVGRPVRIVQEGTK